MLDINLHIQHRHSKYYYGNCKKFQQFFNDIKRIELVVNKNES